MQAFDVADELLDAVDLAATLDLDGDDLPIAITAQQVDRTDRGRVLTSDQRQARLDGVRRCGEQLLQVGLDTILLQAGVVAELGLRCRTTPRAA